MTFEEWWNNWSPEPIKDEYERGLAKRAWDAATEKEREPKGDCSSCKYAALKESQEPCSSCISKVLIYANYEAL